MEKPKNRLTKKDFFHWDASATGRLMADELEFIRDESVGKIVEFSLQEKFRIGPSKVVLELALHGNYQKAALILKEITRISLTSHDELMKGYPMALLELLETEDLMRLPRNPDEARKYWCLY